MTQGAKQTKMIQVNYDNLKATKKSMDLIYIIDVSMSMIDEIDDVRNQLNQSLLSLREKSANENVDTFVTVLSFSEEVNVLRLYEPLDRVSPLEAEELSVQSNTALYDAMVFAIDMANQRSKVIAKNKLGGISIILFTDGEENQSVTTRQQMKKKLKKATKRKGWNIDLASSYDASLVDFIGLGLKKSQTYSFEQGEETKAVQHMEMRVREYFKKL